MVAKSANCGGEGGSEMSNRTTGVLLRSEDGHRYFIPHTQLDQYAVNHEKVDHGDIATSAPRMEAWAAQQDDEQSPYVAMMTTP
jgi:hypothetical protein